MTNLEMSKLITQSENEILALESQIFELQERLDLLKGAEAMRKSILLQMDTYIKILKEVDTNFDTNQVSAFKAEIDEKFKSEWRSEWDSDKLNPTDISISPSKTAAISDKKLSAIFGERRVKESQQFLIIQTELTAIGIKVGGLIKSRDDIKGWNLSWSGDKAALYWSSGNGWEVSPITMGKELTGSWEDFDLIQHLECNGINLDLED